jgi:hypothetical protein
MSSNGGNGAGSGSGFRLVILLVIMAMLGGALGYDMYNEVPFRQMEKDIDRLLSLNNKAGTAATRSDVEEALGKKAASTYKTETQKYEVAHYNYYRTIPFIPGGKIYVVYDSSGKYVRTGIVTSSELITEKSMQGSLVSKELDPNAMPMMGLGGQVSTPQLPDAAKKKDEEKKEGDQAAAAGEEKKDETKGETGDQEGSDDKKEEVKEENKSESGEAKKTEGGNESEQKTEEKKEGGGGI